MVVQFVSYVYVYLGCPSWIYSIFGKLVLNIGILVVLVLYMFSVQEYLFLFCIYLFFSSCITSLIMTL